MLTNKGERAFNPWYGSNIRRFLFEPLDFGTAQQIQSNIEYSISNWETRIDILELNVIPNFDDNGFDVELTYVIIGSDNPPTSVEFFLTRTR